MSPNCLARGRGFKTGCGKIFLKELRISEDTAQKKMTEQKRLETKESTKYSVLEITTTTLFRLTTSDNLQDSSVI